MATECLSLPPTVSVRCVTPSLPQCVSRLPPPLLTSLFLSQSLAVTEDLGFGMQATIAPLFSPKFSRPHAASRDEDPRNLPIYHLDCRSAAFSCTNVYRQEESHTESPNRASAGNLRGLLRKSILSQSLGPCGLRVWGAAASRFCASHH